MDNLRQNKQNKAPTRKNDKPKYQNFKSKPKKPFKDDIYKIQIDKQGAGLQESNFPQFIEQLVEQILFRVESIINDPNKKEKKLDKKLKLILCLERNKINDNSVKMLVEALIKLENYINIDIIRLHMNAIRDEGMFQLSELVKQYKIPQLHLSHNYITWVGFEHLYRVVMESGNYPILPNKLPIWMRLEYNIIDELQINNFFLKPKNKQVPVCLVNQRGTHKDQCNIRYCSKVTVNKKTIKLHLPYIIHQKKSLSSLYKIKSKKIPTSKKLETPAPNDIPKQQASAQQDESVSEEQGEGVDEEETLLIILDTCTIISMSMHPSEFFSFADLIERKKRKLISDSIQFILLDTVFQQLDERKKETNNALERNSIRNFVDTYLTEASRINLLNYIHPMELEDEVRARGGHISNQDFRKSNGKFDSDGLILDCGYYLLEKSPGNILILTDDLPCKSRSLLHKLPAETMKTIRQKLSSTFPSVKNQDKTKGGNNEVISMNKNHLVSACHCKELFSNKIENLGNLNSPLDKILSTPASSSGTPKNRSSLFTELSNAAFLVQQLSSLIERSKEFVPSGQVDLLQDYDVCLQQASASLSTWNHLLDNHQQLKKFQPQSPSSPAFVNRKLNPKQTDPSSPSLFSSLSISTSPSIALPSKSALQASNLNSSFSQSNTQPTQVPFLPTENDTIIISNSPVEIESSEFENKLPTPLLVHLIETHETAEPSSDLINSLSSGNQAEPEAVAILPSELINNPSSNQAEAEAILSVDTVPAISEKHIAFTEGPQPTPVPVHVITQETVAPSGESINNPSSENQVQEEVLASFPVDTPAITIAPQPTPIPVPINTQENVVLPSENSGELINNPCSANKVQEEVVILPVDTSSITITENPAKEEKQEANIKNALILYYCALKNLPN